MKLLLIEDDITTAGHIVKSLRQHGHIVDLAPTGRDGLFLAAGETYDVMIVDRMLPGLDGLGIVKTIRGAGMKTPVLFLTTLGGIDDRVEGLEAGGMIISSSLFPSPNFLPGSMHWRGGGHWPRSKLSCRSPIWNSIS